MHSNTPPIRHSFIVRIWQEKCKHGWQGWIQHVGSGESALIREMDELLAFIEHCASDTDITTRQGLR